MVVQKAIVGALRVFTLQILDGSKKYVSIFLPGIVSLNFGSQDVLLTGVVR